MQFLRRRGRRHPNVDHGNGRDERSNQGGGRSAGKRVVEAAAPEVGPDLFDELPRRLREEVADRPGWSLDVLLRPQVEEGGWVGYPPHAVPAFAFGFDDAFGLQSSEDAMGQAQGDPSL